jgi:aspartyl-tRNA(Asn)/glutamyl-tRNA(Gln) amidotransferase subunit B
MAKAVSNWLTGECTRLLNSTSCNIENIRITPPDLCNLIGLVQKGIISGTSAKTVFEEMFNTGRKADDIIKQQGLGQITDTKEIEDAVEKVIAANPQPVADYKAGKTQAVKFMVGQIMRTTRGRANANLVQELLIKKIEGK